MLLLSTIVITFNTYDNGRFLIVAFIAFIIRLVLIYLESYYAIFGHGDLVDYLPFFDLYLESTWSSFFTKTHVFFYTSLYPGWLYSVLGATDGIIAIKAFSALFSILVIIPLNSIIKSTTGIKLDNVFSALILFWPTWLRFSIEVGRSSITAFFLLCTIAIMYKLILKQSLFLYCLLAISIYVTLYLRIHYVAIILPMLVLGLMRVLERLPKSASLLIFTFLSFLFITLSYKFYFSNLGSYIELDSVEGLSNFASRREEGGSVYLVGIYPTSILDLLWYLPLHAFYFMYSPMIFDVRSAFQLGSSLQSLLVLFITYKLLINRVVFRKVKLVLVVILCGAIGFGSVTKNAGGAERWRLPFTLIILSLAICAVRKREEINSIEIVRKEPK